MKSKMKILMISCGAVLLGLLLINTIHHLTEETTLSEKQIISRVETLYVGVVEHVIKKGPQYMITFSTEKGTYEVAVDEVNGRFSNLTFIYEKPTIVENETSSHVKDEETPVDKPNTPSETDVQTSPPVEQPSSPNETDAQTSPPVEQPSSPPPQENPILLTEQQAIAIVQKQFSGEIEDVDYENTADGGYYAIEVDTETEEIKIRIHAITGKILSVSFDD
ncbi:PepSY domain-containing protein [Lysinibacillus sp. LZ02]|uniref:PepSY domain-containing protein n=1 Tax=Lysinibacillus sp. LZ02 TaxID=3420668 RepID=UPI003D369CE3